MYFHIYVCTSIYIYIYIYIYTYIYLYIYIYIYIYIHIYVCIYIYHACIYISTELACSVVFRMFVDRVVDEMYRSGGEGI